jgi:hypothetical protein
MSITMCSQVTSCIFLCLQPGGAGAALAAAQVLLQNLQGAPGMAPQSLAAAHTQLAQLLQGAQLPTLAQAAPQASSSSQQVQAQQQQQQQQHTIQHQIQNQVQVSQHQQHQAQQQQQQQHVVLQHVLHHQPQQQVRYVATLHIFNIKLKSTI